MQRRLPHLYTIGRPLFITFRLHGSLPPGRQFPSVDSGKAFVCMDRLLDDQRTGPAYMHMPAIAEIVADAIRRVIPHAWPHAWVVMPNHVHLLLTPQIDPSVLLRRLKGASAREANKLLARTGQPFWQDESYDRLVRNAEEFRRIENYVLQNPVRAGLARLAEEYRWSSAFRGVGQVSTCGRF